MNRRLTALFAALEALLVVGVGVGIPLVPLTLMWAFQYGLQLDWIVFWRSAVDAWLLGHGTDIRFTLEAGIALGTGIPGAEQLFLVTIAPLAFALVTALLGVRAGRRIGETPYPALGVLVALGVFGGLALGVTLSAVTPLARPSITQGVFFTSLVFALGLGIGTMLSLRAHPESGADAVVARTRRAIDARVPGLWSGASVAIRGGAAAAAVVVACGAIAVAVSLGVGYGQVIALYEAAQSGVLGGAALTVAQLALLPNLVIWAASWFVGPGFALGVGSSVSPIGTALGPLPAIPVLGALPTGPLDYGFVGLLVPVLAGFLSATVLRGRLVRDGLDTRWPLVGVTVGAGVVTGVVLGALAAISAGSAGPGRLAEVGPSWLAVGGFAALEVALGMGAALAVSALRERRRGRADDAASGPDAGDSNDGDTGVGESEPRATSPGAQDDVRPHAPHDARRHAEHNAQYDAQPIDPDVARPAARPAAVAPPSAPWWAGVRRTGAASSDPGPDPREPGLENRALENRLLRWRATSPTPTTCRPPSRRSRRHASSRTTANGRLGRCCHW